MLYTEVLSGLWIGDIDIMYNKKFIEDNQIKLIINCTIDYKFSEFKRFKILNLYCLVFYFWYLLLLLQQLLFFEQLFC